MSESGVDNVGNRNDYAFGCAEGWSAFEVVRWHLVEEISRPFRLEVVLLRTVDRGPVDLDALLDAPASLRLATAARWRVLHGIVVEAEEIERTAKFAVVRVCVMPALTRARHRRRCRNFVDRSLSEILTAVLENRSPAYPSGNAGLAKLDGDVEPAPAEPSFEAFTPPIAQYRFAINDRSRIDDATLTPYVVQYNESDFDFLSRWLEKEGISYFFEHTATACVMTLTDTPGQPSPYASDASFTLRSTSVGGAAARTQEAIRSLRDARRLRTRAVTVREFDWHRSLSPFDAATNGPGDPDLLGAFEFAGEDENNASSPGAFPSLVRAQRYAAEGALREGAGTVRTLEPGYRCTIEDDAELRDDVEVLVVRVETYAIALTPEGTPLDFEPFGFDGEPASRGPRHACRFAALPTSIPFRPALCTPKPRIHGLQSAMVTAEEFAGAPPEINADKNGSVRLRFPWDQRPNTGDGTPTSNWVRVSHAWAGGGFGGMCVPRVGHEVLVAYVHGDPDRPIVVGRVYNPQSPPPYDASQQGTRSTLRSQSSPNATGSNELRFEDAAGSEEVYLHAQLDMNHQTERNHDAKVGLNHSVSVGNNQTNDVGVDHTQTVGGNHSNSVKGNHTNTVGGNHTNTVGGNHTHTVAGHQAHSVGGDHAHSVGGSKTHAVGGTETHQTGGSRTHVIGGSHTVSVAATHTSQAGAQHHFIAPDVVIDASGSMTVNTTSFTVHAGSATLSMQSGLVVLSNGAGSVLTLMGGMIMQTSAGAQMSTSGGAIVDTAAGPLTAVASAISLSAAGAANVSAGGAANVKAGGVVSINGSTVKLNG